MSSIQSLNAQNIESNQAQIYMEQRIQNITIENSLVSLKTTSKLKPTQVEKASQQIWSLWKSVNDKIEKLPELSSSRSLPDTMQRWSMIGEDDMPFYFVRKGGVANGEKYPLFLNLHGSGPKAQEIKATLAWSMRYADGSSLYFIPQIPNEKRYRWWFKPEQYAWEKLFRLAMLDTLIDANKIYITGISEGGYGSQRLGAFYADYLAGVGPMAGGEPLKNAPPLNYRNVAFSFETGENDLGFGRNKLTALAATTFDSLEKSNPGDFVHKIVLQSGKGHGIDYTKTTPWLVKYKRNSHPNHISWVHFPMHERYRKGFYNIAIEEPLNIKEGEALDRAFFDIQFDKRNNTIKIESYLTDGDLVRKEKHHSGSIAVYLSNQYVDFSKKVKVIYNGKSIYNSKVKLTVENLVESCALYGDPYRLFPAKISVRL
ncbi:MAG: hypothetical protein E6Q95_06415 [Chitinophagaceae bacterium]|nr:MAG: hypothetical protein E6Q95_06415 [Chitinophagaceae bacterium]